MVIPKIHHVLIKEDLARSITDAVLRTITELNETLIHPINRMNRLTATKNGRTGRERDPIGLVLGREEINGAGLWVEEMQWLTTRTSQKSFRNTDKIQLRLLHSGEMSAEFKLMVGRTDLNSMQTRQIWGSGCPVVTHG